MKQGPFCLHDWKKQKIMKCLGISFFTQKLLLKVLDKVERTAKIMYFLLCVSLSWAQAPGDEEDRCTVNHNDPPIYPDTQRNLMDSWNYVNLLPGNGTGRPPITTAVWNDYSYDGNDAIHLFTQTYWQQTSGGICRFISKVCGYTRGTQNNWLFTQHIKKSIDSNIYNYDVTIRVTISYVMSSCRSDSPPSCVQGLTLLYYPTNSIQLPSIEGNGYMNHINYDIFGHPYAPANNVPYTNTYTFILPASTTGFYIAVRDNGTCMAISRLRVYHNNCKAQHLGLVFYPDAPAPVSGSVDINIHCVDNAEVVVGRSTAVCTSNGTWGTPSPLCQCRRGYEEITVDFLSRCREYRSIGFSATSYTARESEKIATVCVEIFSPIGALRPLDVSLLPHEEEAYSTSEFTLECHRVLHFEIGDHQECHDYNINDDMKCELGNTTQFKVQLSISSTVDLDIDPLRSMATVTIDDSEEPECYVRVGFQETRYTISDVNRSIEVCVDSYSPGIAADYDILVTTSNTSNIPPPFEISRSLNFSVDNVQQSQSKCYNSSDLLEIEGICDYFTDCTDIMYELRLMRSNSSDPVVLVTEIAEVVVKTPNACTTCLALQAPASTSGIDQTAIITASVLAVIVTTLVVVVLIIILYCYRKKTRSKQQYNMTGEIDLNVPNASSVLDVTKRCVLSDQLKEDLRQKRMIYSKDQLHLSKTVGQGESGQVYRAYLDTSLGKELVAVKTVKALFSKTDIKRLGKEISTMLSIEHENVMSLSGVCLDTDVPLLIMPFMTNGTLLEFVKNNKKELLYLDAALSACKEARKKMLSMCYQVTKGMEYLAEKRFVHRDLAARNCMIGPSWEIKVADFGLTEDMYGTNYFRRQRDIVSEEKVPIRWMAPESIENDIYNEATDVWSFGVTVWEVFTCGRIPYPGIPAMNIRKILQAGDRLERPDNEACTEIVYDMTRQCWSQDPSKRPCFSGLVNALSEMIEMEAGYLDLSQSLRLDNTQQNTIPMSLIIEKEGNKNNNALLW